MQKVPRDAVWMLTEADVVRLARLALAGLPVVARRDGGVADADRALVEELVRESERVRSRVLRARTRRASRSRTSPAGPGTAAAPAGPAPAPCGHWLATSQVAAALDVDESYVRRLGRNGRLPARRTGRGAWEFDRDAVAAMAADRATRTG